MPVCQICYAKCAGSHFGVATCDRCKSFVVRQCQKMDSSGNLKTEGQIPICQTGGYCDVNGRNRKDCISCLWNRCVQVAVPRKDRLRKTIKKKKGQVTKYKAKVCLSVSNVKDTSGFKTTAQKCKKTWTMKVKKINSRR